MQVRAGNLWKADVLVFDGECAVCDGFVQMVLALERSPTLVFCSISSSAGRALLAQHGCSGDEETIFMISRDRATVLRRSAAIAECFAQMRFPWSLLEYIRVLPAWASDGVYRMFARYRRRLSRAVYGDACPVYDPATRRRFLE